MILIKDIPHLHIEEGLTVIPLKAERLTLAKKRWRGYATDGQEFGFELDAPIEPGTPFHQADKELYILEQKPETLLELHLPKDPVAAAELGWKLGNLHIPIQITPTQALLADDPGMRQNLERQHLHFHVIEGIFRPLRSRGHGHHSHDHGSCGHDH